MPSYESNPVRRLLQFIKKILEAAGQKTNKQTPKQKQYGKAADFFFHL